MQDLRFKTSTILAQHLAEDLAERMRGAISKRGKVSLAVSGGRTPITFFETLSKQSLAWDKVTITLVDERWVEPTDEASNEHLVRRYLLQNEAKHAWFVPLKNSAKSAQQGYMECENRLFEEVAELDYAVLGMGTDGHTASWFAHSNALATIFNKDSTAKCCPVLDAPHYERITLTWHMLSKARHLFLHFEGDDKNVVFETVKQAENLLDIHAMPVRQLIIQQQVALSIYRTV